MKNERSIYENYNIIPNAIDKFSKDIILSVFKHMYRLRKFEGMLIKVVSKNGKGDIRRIHLSMGQEAVGVALAHVFSKEPYFITHRCLELFITLNVPLEKIIDEIFCLDSGCSKGKACSLFSYIKDDIKLYSHTGFIGEQIPIATGFAFANREPTICVTGDGGGEEDYALQAYGFAVTHKLPVLFVCNDNDLSILSKVERRRAWSLVDLAIGFGMKALDVTDDPFTLMEILKKWDRQKPMFINVRVNREYSHSGIDKNGEQAWNRYEIVKKQIIELGYLSEICKIEKESDIEMEKLWKKYL